MKKKQALELISKMQAKADWIERSMDALHELVKAKEIEFARAFLDAFLYKLDTENNVILTTANNKKLIASIDKIYASLKSDITTGLISTMVKDINHIIGQNAAFYGGQSNMSNSHFNIKAEGIKEIVYNRLGLDKDGTLRKDGFMNGLLDMPEVKNKIKDFAFRSVVTKGGFESTKNGFKSLIAGEPEKLGAFSKYHRNYAYDVYSEVDRMNAKLFQQELGMKYFIYNGGLIKNSRRFCIKRAGKVFHVDETKDWADDEDNTAQQPDYQPLINAGGYGCRHSIDYVSETIAFALRPELKLLYGASDK